MITLIGTGHIFDLTAALNTIFDEKQPDVICVELDRQRYQALILKTTQPDAYKQREKNLPIMYKMLARFQDNMADEYGVTAGAEMLTAIQYAQTHGLPVEFIDAEAQCLFLSMWKNMPIREKLRLMLSAFGGFFVSKKTVEKELEQIQDNLDTYLEEIGKKFPSIKKTLLDDRNQLMAGRLIQLNQTYQQVIACVGDGHIPGLSKILTEKNIPMTTIRLHELQAIKKEPADTSSAQFSINYKHP